MASRTTLCVTLILLFLFPFSSPVYSQDSGYSRFAEAYLLRLQSVAAETLINEYEKEFLLLLDQHEKPFYEALPLPERRTYIACYWRLRDPDPFTPGTARLEEHLRRRDYARENFGMAKPPYFDDRGQIYLKYGRSKIRYVDAGSAMPVNTELMIFLPDIQISNQRGLADSGSFEQRVDPVCARGRAFSPDHGSAQSGYRRQNARPHFANRSAVFAAAAPVPGLLQSGARFRGYRPPNARLAG
jgi:GWxTD domain-containing protein